MPAIDEGRQFKVGEAQPGLFGVGRQGLCGVAGEGFGVAGLARFAGAGVEKKKVRHVRGRIVKKQKARSATTGR